MSKNSSSFKDRAIVVFETVIVRKAHQKSDIAFLGISLILDGLAGLLMAEKIGSAIGIPFALFSMCLLFFTWRNPSRR